MHYSGWTTDGELFDSSVARGETISFPLNGVITGWSEGVQLMVVGEKTRFWIPADLAYGEKPRQQGAPAGTLVFDIELLNIKEPPPAPSVPEDVASPPDDATVTASGLAYKVLREGTGTTHPMTTSTVEVHYSGWTTDGKMFDSSVVRDEATRFPLNRVIKGWTEGLQLMVVGERVFSEEGLGFAFHVTIHPYLMPLKWKSLIKPTVPRSSTADPPSMSRTTSCLFLF